MGARGGRRRQAARMALTGGRLAVAPRTDRVTPGRVTPGVFRAGADLFGCSAQTADPFPRGKVSGWRAFAAREPLPGKDAPPPAGRVSREGVRGRPPVLVGL